MKLFAFAAVGAYATPTVKCNNDAGEVIISATVPVNYVQEDLSALGDWDLSDDETHYKASWNDFSDTAKWSKTQEARTRTEAGGTTVTYQALVLKTTVDSDGCDQKTVDNVIVCVKTGHKLTFECSYSLEDQNLDTVDITVSGSDVAESATGTGTLTYTLAMSGSNALTIGDEATATITPKTAGLVHASIIECNVSHDHDADTDTDDQSVSIIDAGLYPVCPLSASVTAGKGTGVLGISWKSFKWTTTKEAGNDVQEDQKLTCSISLSAEAQGQVRTDWEDLCGKDCNIGNNNVNTVNSSGPVKNIATLDECKKVCENNSQCSAVTFNVGRNDCWLKDTCADNQVTLGYTDGISARIS